jgi:hypothetical protein
MPGVVTPFGIHIFHGHTCVARVHEAHRSCDRLHVTEIMALLMDSSCTYT